MQNSDHLTESQMIQKIREYSIQLFQLQSQSSIPLTISESSQKHTQNQKSLITPLPIQPKKQNHYAKGYISPYSQKQTSKKQIKSQFDINNTCIINSNFNKKLTCIYQDKKIKSLFQLPRQQIYQHVQPKYCLKQPIINIHTERNIYNRLQTSLDNKSSPRTIKHSEVQQVWKRFIKKNKQWKIARDTSIIKTRLAINSQNKQKQKQNCKPKKSLPKLTIDECIKKLRRHSQRLKQQLNLYTFTPTLYNKRQNVKEKKSKEKNKFIKQINNPMSQLDFIFY